MPQYGRRTFLWRRQHLGYQTLENHARWAYSAVEDERWDLVVELVNDGPLTVEASIRVDFDWVKATSIEGRQY